MSVRVRDATVEDCEALAAIQVDSYRIAYAGLLPKGYLDCFSYEEQAHDWRSLLDAPRDDLLCVAETDAGEIVGYGLARPGPTEIASYDSELMALHVRSACQHRGGGRLLIARWRSACGRPAAHL
jgi:ribosomal protein S18 acetylase RimI-like enzyme